MATDSINEFLVEGVFPQHSDETTVTGYMAKGAFHQGESVSLISSHGVPLLAPIARIGSAETPVNIVREGQKVALLLKVEPHHVVPGSRLTTRANEAAYGATVIVTSGENESPSDQEIQTHPHLERAKALLDIRSFEDALDSLNQYLAGHPDSAGAHRLLARLHLEADGELADKDSALEHVKRAYETVGGTDPAILETLAQALGAQGEAEHGLRYLERLYEGARTGEARSRYADRIASYRNRHGMADHWEFLDEFGTVVFESSAIDEIVKALKNGVIARDGDCRKNKVGDIRPIRDSLAKETPAVAVVYGTPIAGRAVDYGIGLGAGFLLGILLGTGVGLTPVLSMLAGSVTAAAAVVILHRQRASA